MAESRRPGAGALGPKSKGMVPLALAPPTEPGPGASPVPVPEEGRALPKLTQRGRKGRSLLSSRPQWCLERPVCGDGSSRRRIPAEKTLSSGGIESSLRSGKKPQLITSVK